MKVYTHPKCNWPEISLQILGAKCFHFYLQNELVFIFCISFKVINPRIIEKIQQFYSNKNSLYDIFMMKYWNFHRYKRAAFDSFDISWFVCYFTFKMKSLIVFVLVVLATFFVSAEDNEYAIQNMVAGRCSTQAGCYKGYCWAWCGASLSAASKDWCWTTKTFSKSKQYVECSQHADCNTCWNCAGECGTGE